MVEEKDVEAVCLTCQVRYQFEDDLLQQGAPVVCPTCQVSLVPVYPGTNTPLDQASDATESQWDFGRTQWHGATPSPVQSPAAPAFEAPKWADIAGPLEPLPAKPAPPEQSFTFKPAAPAPAKSAPSAPPLEDWSAAAARWAASGFASDSMPEFIKQPARPSFLSEQSPTQTKSFLPTAPLPPGAPDTRFLEPALRSQSEAFVPTPPPLPAQPEVPTTPAPETRQRRPDTLPPWARGGNEPEVHDQPADARLALSTAFPVTPLAAAIESDTAPEHQVEDMTDEPVRSSHVVLWALLVLLLAGAGGAAVWYFLLQEERNDTESTDKQIVVIADQPASKKNVVPNKVQKLTQANPASEQTKSPEMATSRIQKENSQPDRNASLPDAGLEAYKNGNNFIREGKFKEAISEFRKALTVNPKLSQAHRGLGISFAQLRQNRQACQEYRLYRNMLPPDSKEIPALESILKDCR